jgi:hypothetical protein
MRLILAVLVCLLLVCFGAYAQGDRGTITGTVSDQTGAMISNAPIEAKNAETAAVYKVVSSSTGNYTIGQLPAGLYQITVSAPGFKQFVRTGIRVLVAQTLRVDAKLELGNIQEVVTVNEEAPLLKTESGELSQNVTSDRMDDLPMLSVAGGIRDPYAAINLLPGAEQMAVPGGVFGTLRVNGMPGGTLQLRIEGQDATNTEWSAAYGMSQPGVDSIEETAIQTSNFSAEFGQVGGGMFNMTMRSGTNNFHGSAFDYFRNEDLDAAQPYNHFLPRDRRSDFGFTAGGPVYIPKIDNGKDKTFFFFSFEQNRLNSLNSVWDTVPTNAYRAGDFSSPDLYNGTTPIATDPLGRPIYNGEIFDPSTTRTVTATSGPLKGQQVTVRDQFMGCDGTHPNVICLDPNSPRYAHPDPVAMALQKRIPAPTTNASLNNYNAIFSGKDVTTIPSIKMDHNLSSKLKLSGYWSMNDTYVPFPDGMPAFISTERDLWETAHTVRLNLDYTISPTMLLHLGGGYMGFVFYDPVPGFGSYNNQTSIGLPGTANGVYPTIYNLYQTQGGGMGSTSGQGNSMGPVAQQHQWQQKPTGSASLTWVKGNHSYKFGAEVRVESYPSIATTPSNGWFYFGPAQTALPYLDSTTISGGPFTSYNIGFPYASFMLGQMSNGQIGVPADFHIGKHAFGFFAQDSWKVTPKLTIDYGLRYDYQTYLKEGAGRIPSFGYNTPNPAYPGLNGAVIFEGYGPGKCNCEFASNYPYAFGPRLGLAYQITPKTVFRGGIGVSYSQTADLEMWSLRFGSDVYFGPNSTFGLPVGLLKNGPNVNGTPVTPVWPNYDAGQAPVSPGAAFMTSMDRHAGYPPRQLMWSVGIQRELSRNMSLEVSYVGNRGVWWNSNGTLTDPNRVTPGILTAHNFDPTLANQTDDSVLISPLSSLTPTQLTHYNLSAPFASFSGTVSQALRPYPQFGSIFVLWAPLGNTWYDAMQVKFTKRFSHGLDLTANYSFQKETTIGTETEDTAFEVNPAIINLNNLRSNKVLSGESIPHRIVIAGTYTTPAWGSAPRAARLLMKDWRFGAYLIYQSGLPIQVPIAGNNPNPAQELSLCAPFGVLGGCNASAYFSANASYQSRVPGQPLFTKDINSHYDPTTTTILNASAWASPPPGQFGTGSAYYNDYRYRRAPTENLSLERIFRVKETRSLTFRVELNNAFNRTRIPVPFNTMVIPGVFGTTPGSINAGGQRSGQIVGRFNF